MGWNGVESDGKDATNGATRGARDVMSDVTRGAEAAKKPLEPEQPVPGTPVQNSLNVI
jgi:hypothetical protein